MYKVVYAKINYMIFKFKKINCPICELSELQKIGLRGGKYQRSNLGIETTIVRCKNCSLIFPNPFPYPKDLNQIYNDEKTYFEGKGSWEIHKNNMKPIIKKFIDKIKINNISNNIKILDVGSGRGEFIGACNDFENINAIGTEVSDEFTRFAKNKEIILLKKDLNELINENKLFDGICLQAVIEHVHNPDQIIKEISQLIKKNGILYIDCPREPNLLSVIGNMYNKITFNKGVYNLQPTWTPFHVFGFNPRSLEILLKKYGFKIEEKLIWANPLVKPSNKISDKVKCFLATQINKLANLLKFSSNMCIWAIKK